MNFLKNKRGHILLQALIVMPVIYIALFLPLNFSIIQHERSVLNDVLDMALQKAAVDGGITTASRTFLLHEMQARGFDPAVVTITPASYVSVNRGNLIEITISVPGNASLLNGVKAIGGSPPPDAWRIMAGGCVMSEKLP